MVRTQHCCWCDQVCKRCPVLSLDPDLFFRTLVHNFLEASLSISIAVDSQIFQTDVYSASHPPSSSPRPRKDLRWANGLSSS